MIETFLFRIKRNFNHLILCRGLYYIQKTTLQRRVVSMHRYVNMIATSLRWSKPDQVQRVRNTFVSASKSSPSDCYLLILFLHLKL